MSRFWDLKNSWWFLWTSVYYHTRKRKNFVGNLTGYAIDYCQFNSGPATAQDALKTLLFYCELNCWFNPELKQQPKLLPWIRIIGLRLSIRGKTDFIASFVCRHYLGIAHSTAEVKRKQMAGKSIKKKKTIRLIIHNPLDVAMAADKREPPVYFLFFYVHNFDTLCSFLVNCSFLKVRNIISIYRAGLDHFFFCCFTVQWLIDLVLPICRSICASLLLCVWLKLDVIDKRCTPVAEPPSKSLLITRERVISCLLPPCCFSSNCIYIFFPPSLARFSISSYLLCFCL